MVAGEIADLEKQFPEKTARVIRAFLVEGLLTDSVPGVKVHQRGVRIVHATVTGPLDVRNANVAHETWLDECELPDTALFSRARFQGLLSFDGSSLAAADFNATKVDGHVFFRRARFTGPVNFGSAQFGSNFEADDSQFMDKEKEVNFNSMKVGQLAFFRRARFAGPVNFGSAQVGSNLEADEAQFTNKEKEANFNSVRVGQVAFFRKARFAGPVNFGNGQVASNFEADDAQFTSEDKGVIFNSLTVGHTAHFARARFAGPVDFGSVQVASTFEADDAQFTNKEKGANFNSMKVGQSAFFRRARFTGPVNFGSGQVVSNFEADDAQFTSREKEANFNSLTVGHTAHFARTRFAGPVNFVSAQIGSNFEAHDAQFTNKDKEANFDSLRVKGITFFTRAVFDGSLSMADARLLDLLLEGTGTAALDVRRVDLSRTEIARALRLEHVHVGQLVATSLRVAGPTTLNHARIEDGNLEHSHFLTLEMSETSWPAKGALRLDGMAFQHATAGSDRKAWKTLLDEFVSRSAYSAGVYTSLEEFLRRQGYTEQADDVYVAMKRRERAEVLTGIAWARSVLLDGLVRYGRNPEWAFGWSALFVAFGALLFRGRDKMEPRNPQNPPKSYSACWYSLDLFLPFVDLYASDGWAPKEGRRFAQFYVRVHVILGWILIPLGLAALTGIIK